jgi:hypothetical protein
MKLQEMMVFVGVTTMLAGCTLEQTLIVHVNPQEEHERLLAVPREKAELPPYSEKTEFDFMINQLTGQVPNAFIQDSIGRELAGHHLDAALKRMQRCLRQDEIYNTDMVMDGLGYLRHERCFEFLQKYSKTIHLGHRTFPATMRAISRQNGPRAFNELLKLKKTAYGKHHSSHGWGYFFDALGESRDPRVPTTLKSFRKHVDGHNALEYLRALVKHGDAWAAKELAQFMKAPEKCELLVKGWTSRDDVAKALTYSERPESTETLKQYVIDSWPRMPAKGNGALSGRWGSNVYFPPSGWQAFRMNNFAGQHRRTYPLGEVARRAPTWLAELALRKCGSENAAESALGRKVFRYLTAHTGPMKPHEWWKENKNKNREEWLLAHFQSKGYQFSSLSKKESIPVLVEALSGDLFTHRLAVEQLSVITGKFFCHSPKIHSYQGPEKMTIRVKGWLRARGYELASE